MSKPTVWAHCAPDTNSAHISIHCYGKLLAMTQMRYDACSWCVWSETLKEDDSTDSIFFDGRSKSLAIVLPLVQECKRSAGRCSISFIRQVGKIRTSYFKHIG